MKLQRIMIDAGFTCPNRDGRVGRGGCTYCRADSFAPDYCRKAGSITEQIKAGKEFFKGKYPEMRYLAYFQSYSNTYAPIDVLRQRYSEALSDPEVVGLTIATRPDCIDEDVLQLLVNLQKVSDTVCKKVQIEIGIESTRDDVLKRINRGHSWQQAVDAVELTARYGIPVCVHIIIGLPGESREQMLRGATLLSHLPIDSIKLHQLQILKGTRMAEEFGEHPEDFVQFATAEEYVGFVREYIRLLGPKIKVERIVSSSPSDLLISPRWGLKPTEIAKLYLELPPTV